METYDALEIEERREEEPAKLLSAAEGRPPGEPAMVEQIGTPDLCRPVRVRSTKFLVKTSLLGKFVTQLIDACLISKCDLTSEYCVSVELKLLFKKNRLGRTARSKVISSQVP